MTVSTEPESMSRSQPTGKWLTRQAERGGVKFLVYQGATRGLYGAGIARELGIRRQTVAGHLLRMGKVGWIQRVPGTRCAIYWKQGPRADEADRLYVGILATGCQSVMSQTDLSTVDGGDPEIDPDIGRFGGPTLYIIGPTLVVPFPDTLADYGPGLLSRRGFVTEKLADIRAGLNCVLMYQKMEMTRQEGKR